MLIMALAFIAVGVWAKDGLQFDKARYGISAGESIKVEYTLPKEGKVEVNVGEGWKASVEPNGGRHGFITLTAPDPATKADVRVVPIYPGGTELAVKLNVMVKDPYTDATRPKANLQIWGGLAAVNTTEDD